MSIQNFSSNGTWSIGEDGGYNYHRNTQDGHGGRAAEHRKEMADIAKAAVYEYAPEIAAAIYNDALTKIIGAIEYDVETIVTVSMADAGEIFNGTACQKIISDRIVKEIQAKLEGLTL